MEGIKIFVLVFLVAVSNSLYGEEPYPPKNNQLLVEQTEITPKKLEFVDRFSMAFTYAGATSKDAFGNSEDRFYPGVSTNLRTYKGLWINLGGGMNNYSDFPRKGLSTRQFHIYAGPSYMFRVRKEISIGPYVHYLYQKGIQSGGDFKTFDVEGLEFLSDSYVDAGAHLWVNLPKSFYFQFSLGLHQRTVGIGRFF